MAINNKILKLVISTELLSFQEYILLFQESPCKMTMPLGGHSYTLRTIGQVKEETHPKCRKALFLKCKYHTSTPCSLWPNCWNIVNHVPEAI